MLKKRNYISKDTQPTVSVVMPCYNASLYLREAIESVLSQTYQDWELLIVDDGSTDNSKQIAQECTLKDKRIRLIEQPNGGACRARNNGIEHAQGMYIKFLDADDVLCPDCLEEQVQQIAELQPNQIPFGDYGQIDVNGCVLSTYEYTKEHLSLLEKDQVYAMFSYWQILITAPLHRKELLVKVNGFDTDLPRHQETDLHFRLAIADVQFIYHPLITFYYREYTSDSRITSNYRSGKIKEIPLRLEIYEPKKEQLLLQKYGQMPTKYKGYFTNVFFDGARYYFAVKQLEKGKQLLEKVRAYGDLTLFMRSYTISGKWFGYINIERIFRLRLKLLHKETQEK